MAFEFLQFFPGVQLLPGEAHGFLSVELGSGDGGDAVPAVLVVALPCGEQEHPDLGDAAPTVQVDVHPGAADGAVVEIFSFAGDVPALFPLVLLEDVPEGGGQLGLQGLVFLFPPGLAVLAYGDGPGRVGAGVGGLDPTACRHGMQSARSVLSVVRRMTARTPHSVLTVSRWSMGSCRRCFTYSSNIFSFAPWPMFGPGSLHRMPIDGRCTAFTGRCGALR